MDDVPLDLSVHNAYLNVCAERCKTLVELSPNRRRQLLGLAVDISPAVPLRLAERQAHTRTRTRTRTRTHTRTRTYCNSSHVLTCVPHTTLPYMLLTTDVLTNVIPCRPSDRWSA